MPTNINCQCFRNNGDCLHPAVPQPFFGKPQCLIMFGSRDPRVSGCALLTPKVAPPPREIVRGGKIIGRIVSE